MSNTELEVWYVSLSRVDYAVIYIVEIFWKDEAARRLAQQRHMGKYE